MSEESSEHDREVMEAVRERRGNKRRTKKEAGKMTELKTLKDLQMSPVRWKNPVTNEIEDMPEQTAICEVPQLKAEAIKWVKEMKNARYGDGENWKERLIGFENFYDSEYDSFEYVFNWIKHFFNITEEDLK